MGRFAETRGGLTAAAGLAIAAALAVWPSVERGRREVARAFMPGPLGNVDGLEPNGPTVRAYRTRAVYQSERPDGGIWARRNGLTSGLNFSHNLRWIFPPELYPEHPEFFPLIHGERLRPSEGTYYWQPDLGRKDVAVFAAAAAQRFFEQHPGAESFSLGINDGLQFGESPEVVALVGRRVRSLVNANDSVRAVGGEDEAETIPGSPANRAQTEPRLGWFRERPDYSPLVFTFMNRAADEVARTHPDKLLGCLAYYWCENAPPFPVRRQVVPFLTADRAQGYDETFRREEALLQRRWVEAKRSPADDRSGKPGPADPGRLGLYDYLYGGGYLIPRVWTRLLAENLRQARRAGFSDYFAEAQPNWGLDGPMPWLAAQLLQDPEQSPEALLDEYYGRCFGGAAVSMRRFFERCERQWMTQPGRPYWLKHFRSESQAEIFPSGVCRELRRLLDAAATEAAPGIDAQRVRLVSDAFGVTERLVAMQEAREDAVREALRAAGDWRKPLEALRRFTNAQSRLVNYTQDLQRRQPLAVAEVDWRDYLRDDPAAVALAAVWRRAVAAGRLPEAETSVKALPPAEGMQFGRSLAGNGAGRELLREGALDRLLRPLRWVTGLDDDLGLPGPWQTRTEPCEYFQVVHFGGERPALRLGGSKDTQIYQWCAAGTHAVDIARVSVRGRISASGNVSLLLGWLDKDRKNLDVKILRLPEGDWPQFVELEVTGSPPPGAAWVGTGIRVQNQDERDWMEVRAAGLEVVP